MDTKKLKYPRAMWGAPALLNDDTCELLASVGPFDSKDKLDLLLKAKWSRWEVLGTSLFEMLNKLEIPEIESVSKKKSGDATHRTASGM